MEHRKYPLNLAISGQFNGGNVEQWLILELFSLPTTRTALYVGQCTAECATPSVESFEWSLTVNLFVRETRLIPQRAL